MSRHVDAVDLADLERAARALLAAPRSSPELRGAYAGANGPIFSRGAMVTAALAKASGKQPTIVGKPSEAALDALRDRLGLPTEDLLVLGDDYTMDVALGRLGGARTILVRSGIGRRRPATDPRAQPAGCHDRRRRRAAGLAVGGRVGAWRAAPSATPRSTSCASAT